MTDKVWVTIEVPADATEAWSEWTPERQEAFDKWFYAEGPKLVEVLPRTENVTLVLEMELGK